MKKLTTLATIISIILSSNGEIMYNLQSNMTEVTVAKICYNENHDCMDIHTVDSNGNTYILSDLYVLEGDKMYLHTNDNGDIDSATVSMDIYVEREAVGSTLYPLTTVVTEINIKTDMVYCTDTNGNTWSLTGVEDYSTGDIVSLLINNKGTEAIYDDEIINHKYCGTMDMLSEILSK